MNDERKELNLKVAGWADTLEKHALWEDEDEKAFNQVIDILRDFQLRDIQQEPEITDDMKKYVEEKATEAYNVAHNSEEYVYGLRNLIHQIISDVKGREVKPYVLDTSQKTSFRRSP